MEGFVNQADDQIPEDPKRLFAYGSFMEGFFNYKKTLKGKVIFRTLGKVRGILYHQTNKGYPAMIHGDGWVSGEFLEFDNFDKSISLCDKIEKYFSPNHPDNEYERMVSEVELANGETSLAWVYWYGRNDLNSSENPVILVSSGNWRDFMQKR
jgi:gamma-glutamylcyclotransferase (GGCT)/AIG2-like uncharacterized protein YtfP